MKNDLKKVLTSQIILLNNSDEISPAAVDAMRLDEMATGLTRMFFGVGFKVLYNDSKKPIGCRISAREAESVFIETEVTLHEHFDGLDVLVTSPR